MSDPNLYPPSPPQPGHPNPGYAAPQQPIQPQPPQYPNMQGTPGAYAAPPGYAPYGYAPQDAGEGPKSFVVTWLLSLLIGTLGVDRFYLGKVGTGIVKLLTIGGLGVWTLVDLIIILCGGMRDKQGLRLRGYVRYRLTAWLVTLGLWLLGIIGTILSWIFLGFGIFASIAGSAAAYEAGGGFETAPDQPVVEADGPTAGADDLGELEDQLDEMLGDLPEGVPGLDDLPGLGDTDGEVVTSDDQDAALEEAASLANYGAMSKQAIYDYLTLDMIDHYTDEAAQYAMDELGDVDWNANALASAESYVEYGHLSEAATREMLSSEFGAQFTAEEADYAMENLGEVDWNANALATAQVYVDELDYDDSMIREMLTGDYGKFTDEQADYAIENLDR